MGVKTSRGTARGAKSGYFRGGCCTRCAHLPAPKGETGGCERLDGREYRCIREDARKPAGRWQRPTYRSTRTTHCVPPSVGVFFLRHPSSPPRGTASAITVTLCIACFFSSYVRPDALSGHTTGNGHDGFAISAESVMSVARVARGFPSRRTNINPLALTRTDTDQVSGVASAPLPGRPGTASCRI